MQNIASPFFKCVIVFYAFVVTSFDLYWDFLRELQLRIAIEKRILYIQSDMSKKALW